MANTRAYREAEEWVRGNALPELFHGKVFSKIRLSVGRKGDGSKAQHEFDAVSSDGTVVVEIKCSSGLTSGGRRPTGQLKDALVAAFLLSRTRSPVKALVFTDIKLYQAFEKSYEGVAPDSVRRTHVELPPDIWKRVAAARAAARVEQGRPGWDRR